MKIVSLMISFVMLISLSSCGTPRPWTRGDKIAAGYLLAGKAADFYTTERNLDDHKTWSAYEKNPVLGEHPSDTKLLIFFPLTTVVLLGIAHYLPDFRKIILYGYGSLNWWCAYNNNRLYHEYE